MKIPENAKYSDVIKLAIKTKENATGAPLTIRELSRRLGYSYEHIRKVVKGEPVLSTEFNTEVCKLLGLNASDMWMRAQKEKVKRRFGGVPIDMRPPADDFFAAAWPKLSSDDIETLRRIVEGMVLANESRTRHAAAV